MVFSVVVLPKKTLLTPLTKRESLGSLSRKLTTCTRCRVALAAAVVWTAAVGMLFDYLFVVAGFVSGREAR